MIARTTVLRRTCGLALSLAALIVTAACGPPPSPNWLAAAADLSDQTYVVGSKDFDEQVVLCQITVSALQEAGASVTDRCDLGSTDQTRRALLDGDISMYWEYTGTAWASFMREPEQIPDADVLGRVRQRDLDDNDIVWLRPAAFDNTYVIAIAGAPAAALQLNSISDMFAYLRSDQPGTICVEPEYRSSEGGLRGLQRHYEAEIPPNRVQVIEESLIYQSTADQVCLFGQVYSTDGRMLQFGLKVLQDDRNYHVAHTPVPNLRQDVYERAPEVAQVLDPLAAALDHLTILELNSQVSAGHESPRKVARRWLAGRGFISGA
ncbi:MULTISPECIES: glycine betaine ABC transporter substrate-binding protein [Pseudonocardia]|uniref:glycine betaine ABC transporter substrate-binding protein n=1 Tax=Pseudonocardia TaxID=1847 RepID=UPI001E4564E4|nr:MULTISPECIES: glycine betaine ABC transporter substrate-binding protein [Pseudonocardia]